MELRTLTDRLLPMQPIRLIVRVAVTGNEPVRGTFILYPQAGRCGLVVEGEGVDRQVNCRDMALNTMGHGDYLPPAQGLTYDPGFEVVLDVVALYAPQTGEYLLPSPGRYDLQFWVQFFAGTGLEDYRPVNITSNVVSLTVEEPQEERFASRVWRLPWGMPQPGEDYGVGAGFSSWSSTSYGQYARFAMSGWEEISRPERIRLLRELAREGPPRQIADLVLLRLSEMLLAEEDFAGALEYATQAEQSEDTPAHAKVRAADLRQQAERRLGQGAG